MTKMYVKVSLSGYNTGNAKKKWAWVQNLGHALLNYVEFTIGGTTIDKHYGDWYNIWHNLSRLNGQDRGYDEMIGNTQDLTTMASNHDPVTLYIPLYFFFNRNNGLALP